MSLKKRVSTFVNVPGPSMNMPTLDSLLGCPPGLCCVGHWTHLYCSDMLGPGLLLLLFFGAQCFLFLSSVKEKRAELQTELRVPAYVAFLSVFLGDTCPTSKETSTYTDFRNAVRPGKAVSVAWPGLGLGTDWLCSVVLPQASTSPWKQMRFYLWSCKGRARS